MTIAMPRGITIMLAANLANPFANTITVPQRSSLRFKIVPSRCIGISRSLHSPLFCEFVPRRLDSRRHSLAAIGAAQMVPLNSPSTVAATRHNRVTAFRAIGKTRAHGRLAIGTRLKQGLAQQEIGNETK